MAASEELGWIGVGTIGAPMARRLQGAGRALVVHDLRPEALRPFAEAGARAAASPREVAERCRVVLSSLPGPAEVEAVVRGEAGILPMPVVAAAHQTYLRACAQGLGSQVFFATLCAIEAAAGHEVPKLGD